MQHSLCFIEEFQCIHDLFFVQSLQKCAWAQFTCKQPSFTANHHAGIASCFHLKHLYLLKYVALDEMQTCA